MKKLFLTGFVLTTLLFSWTDELDNIQEETTAVFKDNFENGEEMKGGIGGGIVIDLGRPSKGCKGFGVCEITIGITIYDYTNHKKPNQAYALWIEENNNEFAKLELAEPIASNLSTELIVENDVVDPTGEYYIPSGSYNLDSSIGTYGGYLLPLIEL